LPFIREIQVQEPGTHGSHVTAVRWSELTTGPLREASVAEIFWRVRRGARFRTFDERTHAQMDVEARVGFGGTRYLSTVQGGRENDALLALPRF